MDDLLPDLTLAFNETFQMLSISTVLAIIGGLPLGFLIFVTTGIYSGKTVLCICSAPCW